MLTTEHDDMQAIKCRNNGTVQLTSIYDLGPMKSQSERTMTFSENLKKFRKARGLTQPQVWGPAGIAKSSYTSY